MCVADCIAVNYPKTQKIQIQKRSHRMKNSKISPNMPNLRISINEKLRNRISNRNRKQMKFFSKKCCLSKFIKFGVFPLCISQMLNFYRRYSFLIENFKWTKPHWILNHSNSNIIVQCTLPSQRIVEKTSLEVIINFQWNRVFFSLRLYPPHLCSP